jgi:hypothetical protein
VDDNVQVMLLAMIAVCIGILFSQLGSLSIFISAVGIMFIMGAFIIAITAFLLFLREWIFTGGTA